MSSGIHFFYRCQLLEVQIYLIIHLSINLEKFVGLNDPAEVDNDDVVTV